VEWERDKPSRETKVLYWNAVNFISTSGGKRVGVLRIGEDDGSGLEDSSCDILTVSVLQGSQVAPGLSMSLADRVNVYAAPYELAWEEKKQH
jgi:hypothetical protein